MQQFRTSLVVTTIQRPNEVMASLAQGAVAQGWSFVVIGDRKGPDSFELEGTDFYDLQRQAALPFAFAKACPIGHYARKNIGYLVAMSGGAEVIVETDDDNFPEPEFFTARELQRAAHSPSGAGWVNVYRYFHESGIWPRGYPLRFIKSPTPELGVIASVDSPIQQGLANDNPDVDAVYRLIGELPITFRAQSDIALAADQYCPYNSQNTTTFKQAFPLLYLPAKCSFRMTDIWRSFVATRIAHALGWRVLFHKPTVYQVRNDHDLMRDFAEEVDGYLHNEEIVKTLQALPLSSSAGSLQDSMRSCYAALIQKGFVGSEESALLDAWLLDLSNMR